MIKLTLKDGNSLLVNENEIFNIFDRKDNGSEIFYINVQGSDLVRETLEEIEDMLLRDKFAMSALSGLSSSHKTFDLESEFFGLDSYNIAEQMLKQRKGK